MKTVTQFAQISHSYTTYALSYVNFWLDLVQCSFPFVNSDELSAEVNKATHLQIVSEDANHQPFEGKHVVTNMHYGWSATFQIELSHNIYSRLENTAWPICNIGANTDIKE